MATMTETEILAVPIEELELTVRPYNIAKRIGCETFGDVLALTVEDLNAYVQSNDNLAVGCRTLAALIEAQEMIRSYLVTAV
jgi:hypothetical protein